MGKTKKQKPEKEARETFKKTKLAERQARELLKRVKTEAREIKKQARLEAKEIKKGAQRQAKKIRERKEKASRQGKVKFLHTRVPEELEIKIKESAEEMRIPVSVLIRNTLEDAFK